MKKVMCNKQRIWLQKGSFTLEAGVVVPLCMVLMTAVIFLGFYAHDAASMTAVNDYAVLSSISGTGTGEGEVTRKVTSLLGRRLLAAKEISFSMSEGWESKRAVSSAQIMLPLSMLQMVLGEEVSAFSEEVEVSDLYGRKKLLLYKSICDGVSALTEGWKDS